MPFDTELQTANWESPDSIDHEQFYAAARMSIEHCARTGKQHCFLEGFQLFHDPRIVALLHRKIYLVISKEVCFQRRFVGDVEI